MDNVQYLEFYRPVEVFGNEVVGVYVGLMSGDHGIMSITTSLGEAGWTAPVITDDSGETCTVDWDDVRVWGD